MLLKKVQVQKRLSQMIKIKRSKKNLKVCSVNPLPQVEVYSVTPLRPEAHSLVLEVLNFQPLLQSLIISLDKVCLVDQQEVNQQVVYLDKQTLSSMVQTHFLENLSVVGKRKKERKMKMKMEVEMMIM